jgi:hypothetical protein
METRFDRYDVATGQRVRVEVPRVLEQDRGLWAGARLELWESAMPQELPESVLFEHSVIIYDSSEPLEIAWAGHRGAAK